MKLSETDILLHKLSQEIRAAQEEDGVDGAIQLYLSNCGKGGPGCLSCPHPRWRLHFKKRSKANPGTMVTCTTNIKRPLATRRAKTNEDVAALIEHALSLIASRKNLLQMIHDMKKANYYLAKKLENYID